jgi:RNA polymerase sigma factor (sigma-70 family)
VANADDQPLPQIVQGSESLDPSPSADGPLESILLVAMMALQHLTPLDTVAAADALNRLSAILQRYITAVLTRHGIPNPWHEAMDIVQDVWLRFLRRGLARRFDLTRSNLRSPYLFGVCRTIVYERIRRRRPYHSLPLELDSAASGMTPQDSLALEELRDSVCTAIGQLNPTLAEAILARFWDVPPAGRLSDGTRYGRIFRAKAALLPLLQQYAND